MCLDLGSAARPSHPSSGTPLLTRSHEVQLPEVKTNPRDDTPPVFTGRLGQAEGLEEPRAAAEEVHRGVVHEVPNEDADPAVSALVDLAGLDDLLLEGCWDPPIHHVARAWRSKAWHELHVYSVKGTG